MGKQIRVDEPCELLDKNGLLVNPGYSTKPVWKYDRNKINAGWHRIKEWDYYYIISPERGYGITFTLADLGYIGLAAFCWLDFKSKTFKQIDSLSILPMGKMNFPPTSDKGTVAYKDKKMSLEFKVSNGRRSINFESESFRDGAGGEGIEGELILRQDPEMDTMVIATSWEENRKAFYYNQKINCMPADGMIRIGSQVYDFTNATCYGGLDWGRGNWTYKNRWYWGSASGVLNGESFGWNLGYGFSDRSVATENMLFYKGKAHKLDEVTFHMNPKNYMEPWTFTSNDKRFQMRFTPLIDRTSKTDFYLIRSIQHQVFGNFTGSVVLDDGTVLKVENFMGFAEDVLNWW